MLSKKEFKAKLKALKKEHKAEAQGKAPPRRKLFVLNFHGDIRATEVAELREEITAVLTVATPEDEVLLRLESPGGIVHSYGLAASQLLRLRENKISLTVAVDKVAASGGYLMACVADRIIAAPFAVVGSVGVVSQLPNFNRLLRKNDIDFEQFTAGEYKRTVTLFGEITDKGREKFQQEIEEVHDLFKDFVRKHRSKMDIDKVATGEHWYGAQAVALNLIDELRTSDDYLLAASKTADLFEITYVTKKPLLAKLLSLGAETLGRFRV
jgi:serine protease SohB